MLGWLNESPLILTYYVGRPNISKVIGTVRSNVPSAQKSGLVPMQEIIIA